MRKSVRLHITGSVQLAFYGQYLKNEAEKLDIRGFVRTMDDKRIEVFIEGRINEVNQMIELCKAGPQHSLIRDVQMKEDKFQDFKEFKILRI